MASFIQGIWGIRNEQTSGSNVQKPSFANLEKFQREKLFKNSLPRWNAGVNIYVTMSSGGHPTMHPDGKFEYCNIMLHVILKLSYEFARWQHVCHNVDTSSICLKSIPTKNEYTSLTNQNSISANQERTLAIRRVCWKTFRRLVAWIYYGFLVRFTFLWNIKINLRVFVP